LLIHGVFELLSHLRWYFILLENESFDLLLDSAFIFSDTNFDSSFQELLSKFLISHRFLPCHLALSHFLIGFSIFFDLLNHFNFLKSSEILLVLSNGHQGHGVAAVTSFK
jgi:hypothetical protein